MESSEQREDRFRECDALIESIRGGIITQKIAKKIYKLSKGGYRISESRLDDENSLVYIIRQYPISDESFTESSIFVVRGKLGKELNMCD